MMTLVSAIEWVYLLVVKTSNIFGNDNCLRNNHLTHQIKNFSIVINEVLKAIYRICTELLWFKSRVTIRSFGFCSETLVKVFHF